MIIDRYLEHYEFTCRQCDYVWRRTYDVRHVEDEQGGNWLYYSLAGASSASPAAGVICPHCQQPTATNQLVRRYRTPVSAPPQGTIGADLANEEDLAVADEHPSTAEPFRSVRQHRAQQDGDTPQPARGTSKIVVGVDGSPSSLRALRWAAGEARGTGAEIEIVVAWEEEIGFGFTATTPDEFEPEARRRAMGYAAEALGGAPSVSVSIAVHRGRPAEVLVEASHGADLLVVGSPGHSALADLVLGSVSEHCVRHADCPVVVVREPT